jgi:hypothetical protein
MDQSQKVIEAFQDSTYLEPLDRVGQVRVMDLDQLAVVWLSGDTVQVSLNETAYPVYAPRTRLERLARSVLLNAVRS